MSLREVLREPACCADCGKGPYQHVRSVRNHVRSSHAGLSLREKSLLVDRSIHGKWRL